MSTEPSLPPPPPVTIFLKPTFAIVPGQTGLDVRVAAALPSRPVAPSKPTAQA
ncbi:MAG: hypothetical protein IRZ16_16215 [Myxococcaceae bacterium]|nr:hypothetical protein [Myxococcaceae bacterium]